MSGSWQRPRNTITTMCLAGASWTNASVEGDGSGSSRAVTTKDPEIGPECRDCHKSPFITSRVDGEKLSAVAADFAPCKGRRCPLAQGHPPHLQLGLSFSEHLAGALYIFYLETTVWLNCRAPK